MQVAVESRLSDGTFLRGIGDYNEKNGAVIFSSELTTSLAIKLSLGSGIGVKSVATINGKRVPLKFENSGWKVTELVAAAPPVAPKPNNNSDAPREFTIKGPIKRLW